MKVDNAIIMAAGTSSRFAPLSYEKHKALTVVRGEVLIERQIEQLRGAGIQDIYIVTGYKKEQFEYLGFKYAVKLIHKPKIDAANEDMPTIPLSKNGKNVIVLMLDRAISMHIPYIMNEKPELKSQFSGFTYYPNTISYGGYTNVGTPVLFGGYDYVPLMMNERDQESLESKQNEALKVMPVLFDQNNFQVTVCDPPYAGYEWVPDLSIYDDYPGIKAYITEGKFNTWDSFEQMEKLYNRNFFCYSLFKVAPLIIQETLYNNGTYNAAINLSKANEYANSIGEQTLDGVSKSKDISASFLNSYSVLKNLASITNIQDGSRNTFLMIANNTTHEPMLLKEPEYEPAPVIDNTDYDANHTDRFTVNGRTMRMDSENRVIHYHTNMAAMIQIGRWLDYLKELGIYQNTRIIIASDHGRGLGQFDDFHMLEDVDAMFFNSLLMVKDFGDGEFQISNDFLTLGDVPAFATSGIIRKSVNPFTGTDLTDSRAKKGKQMLLLTESNTTINNGNRFSGGMWYSIHDNIFDKNNWKTEGVNPE